MTVTRNELPERVVEIVQRLACRPTPRRRIRRGCLSSPSRIPTVIKAFAAGHPALSRVADFGADAIMIDGAEPGSGEVSTGRSPKVRHRPVTECSSPEDRIRNVADAIARVRPWGVDVATGVESAPAAKTRSSSVSSSPTPAPQAQLPDDASSVKTDDAPYNWEDIVMTMAESTSRVASATSAACTSRRPWFLRARN